MNTTALDCYLTVCETKNFTKAAEKCYISPQGVSKAVKKLEQELGCQLFRRTRQGLELTESGAALQIRARRILEEARFLQEDLERIAEREEHRIGLGIAMGTAQVMGKEFIGQLQMLLAKVGLTSVDSLDLLCESEVTAQRYELAITAGPVDRDEFDAVILRKGCLCAFVHKSHPFYRRRSLKFEELRNQKLITTNPTNGCALPKLEHREMKTLPAEQLASFLREAKESGVYELYYIELATGLRRGELLGLKWEDIDWEQGTIQVRRQIARIDGEVVEAPLKTKNSYRSVSIGQDAVEILKDQQRKTSSEYVFPSPTGGPISPDSVLHMLTGC